MQNFMKTILSAVQTWTKGKIKDSTADWNQNDSSADSYVKNRTHWEEEVEIVLLSEMTVVIAEDSDGYVKLSEEFEMLNVGQTYIVNLNGVEYKCVAREWDNDGNTVVLIGNGTIYGDGDKGNGEPFSCDSYSGGSIYLNAAAGEYTISIFTTETVVHKLDEKYLDLPENIATTDDVQVAVDAASAAQTTADTAVANAANAQSTADGKMDASNPVGTGSFSIGRQIDSVVGDNSIAIGNGIISPYMSQNVIGNYNKRDKKYSMTVKQKNSTSSIASNTVYYYTEISFDPKTGKVTANNPIRSTVGNIPTDCWFYYNNYWFRKSSDGYVISYSISLLSSSSSIGNYIHIVGNGTSDDARSNAHTLDWDGNAWYQGNVYVGGTGQDDESAVKLITMKDARNSQPYFTLIDDVTSYEYIICMRNGSLTSACKATSIEVTTLPTRTEYLIGETFDPTGMVVTLTRQDGATEEITNYTYSEPDMTVAGEQTVTVTYVEADDTYSTEFTITVVATLSSIAITTQPTTVEYTVGDTFSTNGMIITATYTDGSTAEVTPTIISEPDMTVAGEQTVTVSYIEDGKLCVAEFTITVSETTTTE